MGFAGARGSLDGDSARMSKLAGDALLLLVRRQRHEKALCRPIVAPNIEPEGLERPIDALLIGHDRRQCLGHEGFLLDLLGQFVVEPFLPQCTLALEQYPSVIDPRE